MQIGRHLSIVTRDTPSDQHKANEVDKQVRIS
jgi:hypothetical protein